MCEKSVLRRKKTGFEILPSGFCGRGKITYYDKMRFDGEAMYEHLALDLISSLLIHSTHVLHNCNSAKSCCVLLSGINYVFPPRLCNDTVWIRFSNEFVGQGNNLKINLINECRNNGLKGAVQTLLQFI